MAKRKDNFTGIRFLTTAEEYARIAESQRKYINALADQVSQGKPLESEFSREFVAGILRVFADQIPHKQPRKRGQAPIIDSGDVAVRFALLVNTKNKSKNEAHKELAEIFDVSVEAIKKSLKKYGDNALRIIPKIKT